MGTFRDLETERFRQKLEPYADAIYKSLFGPCDIISTSCFDGSTTLLDTEQGIDCIIYLETGQQVTLQEKYREHGALQWTEFTQEYMNGVGTPNEKPGEWFHLFAELYFYGWGNMDASGFEKWLLMDIAKYKEIVSRVGGIERLGRLRINKKHGRASFYAIPLDKIKGAFVTDYRKSVFHSQFLIQKWLTARLSLQQ